MKPISSHIVENTWKEVGGMEPWQVPELVNKMGKQQPVILAYTLAVDNDVFNQAERELLLYLALVVWRIMSKGDTPLRNITEDILERAENANLKMLEYFEKESDAGFFEAAELMIKNYNQPEVLRYILDAVMEEECDVMGEDFEENLVRDENKGLMIIHLKTIIDCFDSRN